MTLLSKLFWLSLLILSLIFLSISSQGALLELPSTQTNIFHPYYFAATAWNGSLESDYSVELKYTPTNYVDTVTLAWDSVTNATSYTIYVGRSSKNYTNTFDAHTNTQLTVRLRPAPLTNCVITVTTTKATNLMYSFDLTNWIKLNVTNYTRANITSRFWKAVGNGSKVYIKQQLQ